MQQLLFIFNPATGGGRIKQKLMEVLCLFAQAGYRLHVLPTGGPGHAKAAAEAFGGEADLVVCCGGDGTLNEVVHGLSALEKPPLLGYIPAGTTNDFASSLFLPKGKLLAATQRILNPRKIFSFDIGHFNQRVFTYVAAFGAFTDVPYTTPQNHKNLLGYFAYLLAAIPHLPSLRPTHVRLHCADGVFEDDYLFGVIANSASVAGFSFPGKHKVRLDDGIFEALLVRYPQNAAQLGELSASLLSGNTASPLLTTLRLSAADVYCDTPLGWTLDGEFGGKTKHAQVRVHQRALDICI